jgi:hypothetical protein
MKKKTKRIIGIILFDVIIFILFIYGMSMTFIGSHELVHKEINKEYNISSTIELDFLRMTGQTISSRAEFNNKCNDSCKLAHNINESVGYQLGLIFLLLSVITYYTIKR